MSKKSRLRSKEIRWNTFTPTQVAHEDRMERLCA